MLMTIAALAMVADHAASAGSAAPRFNPTPAWGKPGALELWVDAANPGALFMQRAQDAVYRYDPQTRKVTPVDAADAQPKRAPAATCEQQYPAKALRLEPATGDLLTASSAAVSLGGRFAVATRTAPSGRYAAILSASGRGESVMPFLGRGSRGPFYHDVVTLPDGRPLSPAVRLPFPSDVTAIVFCWSPNDAYVVYADALLTGVAVVAVSTSGARQ
jgi:hypothetical protein